MSNFLDGKYVWITGASRGIGLAIAEKIAETDAKLILTASSAKSFKDLSDKLKLNKNVYLFPADFSSEDETYALAEKILQNFPQIDVLINNAGVGYFDMVENFKISDLNRTLNINLKSAFICSQSAVKSMKAKKSGVIMNIASIASFTHYPENSMYSASKSALSAFGKCLREEVRHHNIKVINIYPGAVLTDIWEEEWVKKFSDKMIKVESLADLVYQTLLLCKYPDMLIEEIVVRPQFGDLSY